MFEMLIFDADNAFYIYLSVVTTKQDQTQKGFFCSGNIVEAEVANKPRSVRCWSMLVIASLCAM